MTALLIGLGAGLAAGISPGPLLFLTIDAALRAGARAGALVAAAPLLSDIVVVTLTLTVLGRFPGGLLSAVGVVGGLVVVRMGVLAWRDASVSPTGEPAPRRGRQALCRAALVNLLSPHPWLTWGTVLGPLTVQAWQRAPGHGVALVVGFYLALVGSKVAVAALVAAGRGRLDGPAFRTSLRVTSGLLVLAGLVMVWQFGRQLAGG